VVAAIDQRSLPQRYDSNVRGVSVHTDVSIGIQESLPRSYESIHSSSSKQLASVAAADRSKAATSPES
jgi:hypothetical protein